MATSNQPTQPESPAQQGSAKPAVNTRQLQEYTAADAALTTDKPWELVVTSKKLKQLAIAVAIFVIIIHIFMAVVVGIGYTGAAVTPIDQWAFFGVGIIIAVLGYLAFSRPRVRVNADGVDVRNIIGSRFYPWAVIYGLSFPEGSRMARLELPDFEFVPLWAFQSADHGSIVENVSKFRELEAQYMPQD